MGGYKVSVWSHDIRAFLTDEVDEIRGEGLGMGIWVQIGPKFLIDHPIDMGFKDEVRKFLREIGVKGKFPIRNTRIDLALDLFAVEIVSQDTQEWWSNWVGRSAVSSIYINPRSRELETINKGSRRSVFYLRIYYKFAEAVAGVGYSLLGGCLG
jgi:hypothetical protein